MNTKQEILKNKFLSLNDPNINKNVGDRWEQFRKEKSTIAILEAMEEYKAQSQPKPVEGNWGIVKSVSSSGAVGESGEPHTTYYLEKDGFDNIYLASDDEKDFIKMAAYLNSAPVEPVEEEENLWYEIKGLMVASMDKNITPKECIDLIMHLGYRISKNNPITPKETVEGEVGEFLFECKNVRNDFIRKASDEWWLRIGVERVVFEDILIMYDQMIERLKNKPKLEGEVYKWVSVEDDLPTEELADANGEIYVIVMYASGEVDKIYFDHKDKTFWTPFTGGKTFPKSWLKQIKPQQ